jgi:beta-galactosidase
VDLIGENEDLLGYKLLIAPVMYMTKPGMDERIREFVKGGGTFVATFFSGYVDESDLVILGGYPGKLRDILGVWVEEIDALPPHKKNRFFYQGQEYEAGLLCDLMHLEGAESLAEYQEDFYAGMPAVTRNSFGGGQAYYVGTRSGEAFYHQLMEDICKEQQIQPAAKAPDGVEVTKRVRGQEQYLFFLNHGEGKVHVEMPKDGVELLAGKACRKGEMMELEAKGVAILKVRPKQ